MTEVAAIPLPPNAVPRASRPESMLDGAVLNRTEGGGAAVTPIAVSEPPNADIRSDIEPNESQPGQAEVKSQEALGPGPLELRRHVFQLTLGVPPVSVYAALKSERLKSWGITRYRIIMTIVLVLGIPSALLSFLGNSAMASGIIGVGIALCTALLFWVKEYRDQDKNWAPWLFEKDVSESLVTAWALTQVAISVIPVVLISFQIAYLLDDVMFPNVMSESVLMTVSLILASFLQIGASWLVALTVVSDRSRLWLRKMHFVPRILLEEVMVVAQRSISLLLWIGCARLRGDSFDDVMYFLRRDLGETFEDKGSIPIYFAVIGATWSLISALKWAWKMGKRLLRRRI